MSDPNHKKYSGKNVRDGEHASPYPVSRLGAPISLVDSARLIEQASETIALRSNAQLEVIVEQMRALQQKAREVLDRAAEDVALAEAQCRFQRVPGRVYHLYLKKDGRRYFSMLAPDEYSGGAPDEFVASYRYEYGESWTRLDLIGAEDQRRAEIHAFASTRLLKE